ncbi:MAG TPA: M20/M25/M40 family metallo-hydrolase [Thermomonas sp.]
MRASACLKEHALAHPDRSHLLAPALLALLLPLTSAMAGPADRAGPPMATPDDIAQDVLAVPCDNAQRQAAVRALYERMGANPADLRVERFSDRGGVENLVLVKPGRSPDTIVIGAHYDKTGDGCGAVDNWTGQVAAARLYQTLRDVALEKTLVFVAFGREEEGLVGSRAMANAIPEDRLPTYCGMVNIDSLGLARPQVADNMSTRPLLKLAVDVAKEMDIPFQHAALGRANSDSSAFVARTIPAVTIHGLDRHWMRVLHRREDQAARINPASVYLGYRMALAMVARLNQAPCNAYR